MNLEKKQEKRYMGILLLLVFAGSLFLLSFISYSDGDDSFFRQYCTSMRLGEYVKWRYETWSGRVVSEALLYWFFNMDLWVWRIVNAGMITTLPLLLTVLRKKVSAGEGILLSGIVSMTLFVLLDIQAFGYASIWITGSMNYLWPDVCGLIALCIVADFYHEKKPGWLTVPAILCALIAAMSSEQMGAVLLAFEVLCMAALIRRKKSVPKMLMIQTVVTVVAFAVSSMAPGNALRVAESIEIYLPQFETLTLGEKAFMLVQWLASSFANENAVFLAAIWIGAFLILLGRIQKVEGAKRVQTFFYMGFSAIGILAVLASKLGLKWFSDLGLNLSEMTGCITQIPAADMLGTRQWMAIIFWLVALLITFFLLRNITDRNGIVLFTYLGAIASETVMILSPTIYSSGARVFFLAGVMLMFIILSLLENLRKEKLGIPYAAILVVMGIANFLGQIPRLLMMITG